MGTVITPQTCPVSIAEYREARKEVTASLYELVSDPRTPESEALSAQAAVNVTLGLPDAIEDLATRPCLPWEVSLAVLLRATADELEARSDIAVRDCANARLHRLQVSTGGPQASVRLSALAETVMAEASDLCDVDGSSEGLYTHSATLDLVTFIGTLDRWKPTVADGPLIEFLRVSANQIERWRIVALGGTAV